MRLLPVTLTVLATLALSGCRCAEPAGGGTDDGQEGQGATSRRAEKLQGRDDRVVSSPREPEPSAPPPRPGEPSRPRGPAPHPEPTEPDPTGGEFTLEQATEGLEGAGPLMAQIDTDFGTLRCRLYAEQAPLTVANFVGLARGKRPFWDPYEGAWVRRPFYDGLTFHRVIPGFMIQGGCPQGTGRGNPGYRFADEIDDDLVHDRAGLLSMANAGPGTNGSQFFVLDGPAPHLNGRHAIFGECRPVEAVNRIARVPQAGRGGGNRPLTDVLMRRVRVTRGED